MQRRNEFCTARRSSSPSERVKKRHAYMTLPRTRCCVSAAMVILEVALVLAAGEREASCGVAERVLKNLAAASRPTRCRRCGQIGPRRRKWRPTPGSTPTCSSPPTNGRPCASAPARSRIDGWPSGSAPARRNACAQPSPLAQSRSGHDPQLPAGRHLESGQDRMGVRPRVQRSVHDPRGHSDPRFRLSAHRRPAVRRRGQAVAVGIRRPPEALPQGQRARFLRQQHPLRHRRRLRLARPSCSRTPNARRSASGW